MNFFVNQLFFVTNRRDSAVRGTDDDEAKDLCKVLLLNIMASPGDIIKIFIPLCDKLNISDL